MVGGCLGKVGSPWKVSSADLHPGDWSSCRRSREVIACTAFRLCVLFNKNSQPVMVKPTKRTNRAAKKQRAAAVNIAALGLLIVLLPYVVGRSMLTPAFKPWAPFGWLMLVIGVVMWVVLQRKPTDKASTTHDTQSPSLRQPRRPSRPAAVVERLDPVNASVLEPVKAPAAASGQTSPPDRFRPSTWGPGVFAVIEWRRFEAVVEALFAQAGFITKAQSHGPDDGADVWLYSKNQPDGTPVSVVQCKHWQGRAVGVDKVRELRGVMAAKGVARGQLATTSTFTPDAATFAARNGIKLHDGAGLLAVIGQRTPQPQQALLDVALDGEYWKPTCASCGTKMVIREPTAGGKPFWGCVNFPKCRTTMRAT
jgi:restriction system protein